MSDAGLLQVSCFRWISTAGYNLVPFEDQLLDPLQYRLQRVFAARLTYDGFH